LLYDWWPLLEERNWIDKLKDVEVDVFRGAPTF
jgi:hypothetical protein